MNFYAHNGDYIQCLNLLHWILKFDKIKYKNKEIFISNDLFIQLFNILGCNFNENEIKFISNKIIQKLNNFNQKNNNFKQVQQWKYNELKSGIYSFHAVLKSFTKFNDISISNSKKTIYYFNIFNVEISNSYNNKLEFKKSWQLIDFLLYEMKEIYNFEKDSITYGLLFHLCGDCALNAPNFEKLIRYYLEMIEFNINNDLIINLYLNKLQSKNLFYLNGSLLNKPEIMDILKILQIILIKQKNLEYNTCTLKIKPNYLHFNNLLRAGLHFFNCCQIEKRFIKIFVDWVSVQMQKFDVKLTKQMFELTNNI